MMLVWSEKRGLGKGNANGRVSLVRQTTTDATRLTLSDRPRMVSDEILQSSASGLTLRDGKSASNQARDMVNDSPLYATDETGRDSRIPRRLSSDLDHLDTQLRKGSLNQSRARLEKLKATYFDRSVRLAFVEQVPPRHLPLSNVLCKVEHELTQPS